MGAWGVGIFDDDTALDIKGEYRALLAFGVPEDEAYQLIKKEFYGDNGEQSDFDSVFWFAVATIQQKYGILMPDVKENALHFINNKLDWVYTAPQTPQDLKKREKIMNDLKEKLLAPPLPKRKVSKPHTQKPRWKLGDIVVSKIVCPAYEDRWFFNKYVLYRVVRLKTSDMSFLKPGLAYDEWVFGALYDWIGDEIPDSSIIKDLDYYKIFNPQDGSHNIRPFSMYWIPRNEKYTLFQRDCEYPMPSTHEMVADESTGANLFGVLNYAGHFEEVYKRFKKEVQ